jgi:CRISPR-associated protein Cas5d
MLYDMDYADPANITPMYFRARLQDGLMNVAGEEVYR